MWRRRDFLRACMAAGAGAAPWPGRALAASPAAGHGRLLVLVELKGGNDGLNTLIPYADPRYAELRPHLAIPRSQVLQLDDRAGLHPGLEPLLPLWNEGRLALLQGVGYPVPNLSHFRSIEIWDTASGSLEYLQEGWLTRTFAAAPAPRSFAADAVVVGSNDMGPLSGDGARAIALASTEQFTRQARLAQPGGAPANAAMAHILKVESDIRQAALKLDARHDFATSFPVGEFGSAIRTACQVLAGNAGVAAVRVTLGGFDTHQGQLVTHARLLGELAHGLVALREALLELGRWDDTLVLTYAEFGRRPRENQSGGTDHGTASVHFATGGRVRGGFHGASPDLAQLDGEGNPRHAIDFRSVYATVLERWWGTDSGAILGGRYPPVEFV